MLVEAGIGLAILPACHVTTLSLRRFVRVPLIVGLVLGRYVFKFHPGIMLGAGAGARSTTAALGSLQEAAKSNVRVIGYATGYAVSRLVMALLTIVVVNMF